MAKFKVLQFCSTAPGQPDWQIGDVVELADDTNPKGHLERIASKKAPAKKKVEKAVAPTNIRTATLDA